MLITAAVIIVIEQLLFYIMAGYPYRYGISIISKTLPAMNVENFEKGVEGMGIRLKTLPSTNEMRVRIKNSPGTIVPILSAFTITATAQGTRITAKANASLCLIPAAYAIRSLGSSAAYELIPLTLIIYAVIYRAAAKGTKEIAKFIETVNGVA